MGSVGQVSRLGGYDLLAQLGQGGMAEIFLARSTQLPGVERRVVIKKMRPTDDDDENFSTMFLDEARLAVLLEHPNIVRTYDVGLDGDSPYLVLEYLRGFDFSTIVKAAREQQQEIPLAVSLHLICEVARGLEHAHSLCDYEGEPLHIVHRDISPQNLFATMEGTGKVLDFGIASCTDRLSETTTGVLKGKCPYMSPEQTECEVLDARSDLFSLAAVLYELTCGQRLFRGKSAVEVLRLVASCVVTPPSLHVPDYHPELEAIVLTALAARRDDRYTSCGAFADAIEDFAERNGIALSRSGTAAFLRTLFPNARAGTEPPVHGSTRRIKRGDPDQTMVEALGSPGVARPATVPARAPSETSLLRSQGSAPKAGRTRRIVAVGTLSFVATCGLTLITVRALDRAPAGLAVAQALASPSASAHHRPVARVQQASFEDKGTLIEEIAVPAAPAEVSPTPPARRPSAVAPAAKKTSSLEPAPPASSPRVIESSPAAPPPVAETPRTQPSPAAAPTSEAFKARYRLIRARIEALERTDPAAAKEPRKSFLAISYMDALRVEGIRKESMNRLERIESQLD